MEQEDVITVDPVVEPNELVFKLKKNMLEIEYGNQKVIVYDKLQFVEEVQQAVARLGTILDEFADSSKQKKRELIRLRNFLSI
jgi:hypothetical protein